jgi:hypothetical protein
MSFQTPFLRAIPNEIFPIVVSVVLVVSVGGAIETTEGTRKSLKRNRGFAVSLFRCVLGLRVQVSPLHRSSTTIITPSTIIPVTSIIDHRPSRIISRHLILANAACRIPPAPPTLSVYIRCRSASQQDARRQSPFVVVFASCKMQVGKFVLSLGRGKLACRKVNSPRIHLAVLPVVGILQKEDNSVEPSW